MSAENNDEGQIEDIDDLQFTAFDELKGEAPKTDFRHKLRTAFDTVFRWRPDLIYLRRELQFLPFPDNDGYFMFKMKGDRKPSRTSLSSQSSQGEIEKVISAFLTLRALTAGEHGYNEVVAKRLTVMKQNIARHTQATMIANPSQGKACEEYSKQLLRMVEILENVIKTSPGKTMN